MSGTPTGEFARQLLESQEQLYAYLLSLVFHRDVAEELLQQTNLVLCQKADQVLVADSFVAWATGVARLEVLAYRRKARTDKHLFDDQLVEQLADESPRAVEVVNERVASVQYCVEKLSPQQRQLIQERYKPGAQVKELARQRGQNVETVSKALYRARKALLECIERRLRKEVV